MRAQIVTGGFRCGPERHLAIEPMGPAFLRASEGVYGPRIKRIPDWAEHFVNVGDTIRGAPPRRVPWNPVMLIDHQIQARLAAVPTPGMHDARAHAPAAHNLDTIDLFLV